ncbi:response regulator [Myxacorys almedinensis]|uniref:Response regulator n=1 Tax=Myxacorys almedinensis A TaxID=2690445 RepID=A0A8J7YYB3_9CYAN|nr:response regulator [Myxacorys almedinensis]NDJ16872.1 response regulator [Myxacorys almedinensis A]
MRLLFVEDDSEFAAQLSGALMQQHYIVDIATDGETAWSLLQTVPYDLILLDLMLPKLNGLELCQRIRSQGSSMPILFLTAKNTIDDKVLGLDAGADDYLTKPVGVREVTARLRALLRRRAVPIVPALTWGLLQLDLGCHEATYGGTPLSLTPKEYMLLELLLRRGDWVHKHAAILEQLWAFDRDPPSEDAVRSHIKGLRRKLKAVGAADLIETVYGVGYRLNPIYLTSSVQNEALLRSRPSDSMATDDRADQKRPCIASKILVVDRNAPHLELIQHTLEPFGLEVVLSNDPMTLWQALDTHRPDVLVLGADMPAVDRLTLCRVLRKDLRWNWLPTLILTSETDPETIHQIFEAGADDFAHQPIVASELVTRILNRLERVRMIYSSFEMKQSTCNNPHQQAEKLVLE